MPVSSILSPSEHNNYPKLMINKTLNTIVLFTRSCEGTVVHVNGNSCHKLGFFATDWDMSEFNFYPGIITLSNG